MRNSMTLAVFGLFALVGCDNLGAEGDSCEVNADCEEGLECHVHEDDGDDEGGICEAEHDDEGEEDDMAE